MISNAPKQNLTLWEKFDTLLGGCSIAAGVLYAAISGPFRGPSGADTYHHHLIQAAVKKLTTRLSAPQLQYIFPSYEQLYLKHCRTNKLEPFLVSNERGLSGFWIGDPAARYVVLNFHGGGFAMDATDTYLNFWGDIQQDLANTGIKTGWFHCTYTLTPHASYPTQFCEAVEALRYLVEDLGRSPSDIILAGDSAGASLCLAILSHLTHPSDDVPKLTITEPLKAVVLMSPWVSFDQDWPSVKRNEYKDIDAAEVTTRWSSQFLNGLPTNNYIEAIHGSAEWWKGMKVEQTLVLAGEDEVLLDPIAAWVEKFREHNPDTTFVVGKKECHVAPLTWPLFGDYHETEQACAMKHWLKMRLLQ